jgi:hypothetical protein
MLDKPLGNVRVIFRVIGDFRDGAFAYVEVT